MSLARAVMGKYGPRKVVLVLHNADWRAPGHDSLRIRRASLDYLPTLL